MYKTHFRIDQTTILVLHQAPPQHFTTKLRPYPQQKPQIYLGLASTTVCHP